ncbi:hypothetical protein DAPPUDRAFT_118059 [Daphnia pulex]|uniref:Uncharacterized protein n=1 Tax=Daphnia pulex TaxID=6669 RepID=E9HUK1_DAPPU|nr:hypothetical protein DAPPUDRAFT_118059 [Daphnia pulex]|eukprot:EFX64581.1 hypothetical protein DAPPUDRAFT_118059 [Daphnia pulex]
MGGRWVSRIRRRLVIGALAVPSSTLLLGKFAIVDLVVHDVNEERLETALIPDFWLYTCGDKLYCAYPTLKDIKSRNWEKPVKDRQYPGPNWTSWPAVHRRDFDDYTSGREYVNTAAKKTDIESAHESERGKEARDLLHDIHQAIADQSHPYSTKQPHTIGSQAFRDISFSTSTPNIDDVASQNLNIGEAASNDSRFVRCNLGDEDSQLLMDDDNSETSASETTQTVDGEISNPLFGESVVYPTQSGESAVHPTQSGMSAVYPTQSGASAVYPSQSGLKSLHMVLLAILSSVAVVLCLRNLVMKYYRMLGNALVKFVKSIGGANGRDAIKRQWPFLLELLIYKRKEKATLNGSRDSDDGKEDV